jgi:hypothetical protein
VTLSCSRTPAPFDTSGPAGAIVEPHPDTSSNEVVRGVVSSLDRPTNLIPSAILFRKD